MMKNSLKTLLNTGYVGNNTYVTNYLFYTMLKNMLNILINLNYYIY